MCPCLFYRLAWGKRNNYVERTMKTTWCYSKMTHPEYYLFWFLKICLIIIITRYSLYLKKIKAFQRIQNCPMYTSVSLQNQHQIFAIWWEAKWANFCLGSCADYHKFCIQLIIVLWHFLNFPRMSFSLMYFCLTCQDWMLFSHVVYIRFLVPITAAYIPLVSPGHYYVYI